MTILGTICAIVSGLTYIFASFLRGKLATVLIEHGPGDNELLTKGYPYVIFGLIFAIGIFILTFFQNFFLRKACINITANLRVEFVKALLRQDATWLDKQKFGALNAELTEFDYALKYRKYIAFQEH